MFRFKQFAIRQTHAAMKVGTDGALLGAWVNVREANNILDIGTGTGIISMMLGQRNKSALVDAVEIDDNAIIDASFNFENCPWKDRLVLHHTSIQEFKSTIGYDLIVSNPPFFVNSLKSQVTNKQTARHTDSLHYNEIVDFAIEHLNPNGNLALILPVENALQCIDYAKEKGLFLTRLCKVKSVPHKPIHRWVFELSLNSKDMLEEELTIETGKRHDYTDQYIGMCKDFYTIM